MKRTRKGDDDVRYDAGWDETYEPDESGPDECIERDEDNYGRHRRCTCGRDAAYRAFQEYQYPGDEFHDDFDGCRGCDPVDPELKPHGFGIEEYEDEERRERMVAYIPAYPVPLICQGWLTDALRQRLRPEFRTISLRRLRHSEIVWDRLCSECETHREAIQRYKKWAKRSLTVKYRDEK